MNDHPGKNSASGKAREEMKDSSFSKNLKQILTFRRISETDAKKKLREDTWKFYEAEFLPCWLFSLLFRVFQKSWFRICSSKRSRKPIKNKS